MNRNKRKLEDVLDLYVRLPPELQHMVNKRMGCCYYRLFVPEWKPETIEEWKEVAKVLFCCHCFIKKKEWITTMMDFKNFHTYEKLGCINVFMENKDAMKQIGDVFEKKWFCFHKYRCSLRSNSVVLTDLLEVANNPAFQHNVRLFIDEIVEPGYWLCKLFVPKEISCDIPSGLELLLNIKNNY